MSNLLSAAAPTLVASATTSEFWISRGQNIAYLIAALLIGGIFLWQTVSLMGAVKRTYSYLCSAMDVVFAQEV